MAIDETAPTLVARMSKRLVVGSLALAALVAAVAAYGAFGANIWRWGCPSQAELDRLRTPAEVIDAFDDHGIDLAQVRLPPVLANGAPVYRDAVLYRHSTVSATAFILVCEMRCAISRYQLTRTGGGVPAGKGWHVGMILGNNVAAWVTADTSRSGAHLSERTTSGLGDVDRGVDADGRCYIN